MPASSRVLLWPDLRAAGVPYGRQHVLRLEREGKFPARLQFGPGRVGWDASAVAEWVESRQRGPLPKHAHLLAKKPGRPEPSPEDLEALRRMASALGFELRLPEPERREAASSP
jgi:prophage regulatory protein